MKWKNFPHYWPFVRGIHRWPVNSPHKGQWRGALMLTSHHWFRKWLVAWSATSHCLNQCENIRNKRQWDFNLNSNIRSTTIIPGTSVVNEAPPMPLRASSHPGIPNCPSCSAFAWPGLSPSGGSGKRNPGRSHGCALPLRQSATRPQIAWLCKGVMLFSERSAQYMMTSSNGNIFRVTAPLCGEFTGLGEFPAQRPVTRSLDVFFDLRPNKRLSKQPWGWWFDTPSRSLWRQCNDL